MNKKYCIFDMDGTLVDSMEYWKALGREFLNSKGLTEGIDDVLKQIEAMTTLESSALFIETFGLEGTPESVAQEINEMMDDHYRNDIPLKPGVKTYLQSLHEQGVKLCVASAAVNHLVDACLTRLGVGEYFDFFLSCEEVGCGKNRPDVFLEAAKRMGSRPKDTAVFEDALYAIETAKNAGFYTVGVADCSNADTWEQLKAFCDEYVPDWNSFS